MPTYKATLCWDCEKSYKKTCAWSKNFQPVEGWNAIETHNKEMDSYVVLSCPEFMRDSYKAGLCKLKEHKKTA